MLRKLLLISTVCFIMPVVWAAEVGECEYHPWLQKGDDYYHKERYNDAVTCYWEVAKNGVDSRAVDKLGSFYNEWHFKSWYDWDIPRRYLAQAADANYQHPPKKYDGTFFIIAKELSIVEEFGVYELQKTFSGNDCCKRALDNLAKRFYVDGKNGRVFMRAKNISIKGAKTEEAVAVLDYATAIENFKFVDRHDADWQVYVRSPYNPDTLLPFGDFHRIIYEEKMASFLLLCCCLGASEAKVYYQSTDSKSGAVSVQVDGTGVMSYASAQIEAAAACERRKMESAKTLMTFTGSGRVQKYDSPWLDKEPTWRAMYEARRNPINPVIEYGALFNYTDDFRVNAATKAAFESAGCKVSAGAQAEFRQWISIVWKFKVTFPPAEKILD